MSANLLSYVDAQHDAPGDVAPALGRIVAANVRGQVVIPAGTFYLLSPVTLPATQLISLVGEGRDVSILIAKHSGTAITVSSPANTSTSAPYRFADFTLKADAAFAHAGAGIVETGATRPTFERIASVDFKTGLRLEQSEVVSVIDSDFAGNLVGLHMADPRYTNGIRVIGCDFNQAGLVGVGILDDGGARHEIGSCNFNGLDTGIRVGCVNTAVIYGCEVESTRAPVVVSALDMNGGTLGQCANVRLEGNVMTACPRVPTADDLAGVYSAIVRIESAGSLALFDGQFLGVPPDRAPVVGVQNAYRIDEARSTGTSGVAFHCLNCYPSNGGKAESYFGPGPS